jgi:hypothetical protein
MKLILNGRRRRGAKIPLPAAAEARLADTRS